MKDLHDALAFKPCIDPHTDTSGTAQIGGIIDRKGFETLELVTYCGALADADATFAVTVAESVNSDMSSSNAVAATDLIGTLTGASFLFSSDSETFKLGYKGTKRYVQPTVTPTNNTGNATYCMMAVLGGARTEPISAQQD